VPAVTGAAEPVEQPSEPRRAKRLARVVRVAVALEVLAALAVATRVLPVDAWLHGWEETAVTGGVGAPVLYAALYALGVVLLFPSSALTMGAGMLFGTARGFAAAFTGALAGASLAFLIGRHLARPQVESWTRGRPRFAAIDAELARSGWRIVALTRLSPVFPFTILNYAYGATQVRFRDYVAATALGMAPGGLLYTILGTLGQTGAQAIAGKSVERWQTAANVVGLLAALVVTIGLTRMARRALGALPPTTQDG